MKEGLMSAHITEKRQKAKALNPPCVSRPQAWSLLMDYMGGGRWRERERERALWFQHDDSLSSSSSLSPAI